MIDPTTVFELDGVRVEMDYSHSSGRRNYFAYEMYVDGALLFSGNDFGGFDGEKGALALLGFLTCQPGDTDPDYFDSYTHEQMAWARSFRCECLKGEVGDREEELARRRY